MAIGISASLSTSKYDTAAPLGITRQPHSGQSGINYNNNEYRICGFIDVSTKGIRISRNHDRVRERTSTPKVHLTAGATPAPRRFIISSRWRSSSLQLRFATGESVWRFGSASASASPRPRILSQPPSRHLRLCSCALGLASASLPSSLVLALTHPWFSPGSRISALIFLPALCLAIRYRIRLLYPVAFALASTPSPPHPPPRGVSCKIYIMTVAGAHCSCLIKRFSSTIPQSPPGAPQFSRWKLSIFELSWDCAV